MHSLAFFLLGYSGRSRVPASLLDPIQENIGPEKINLQSEEEEVVHPVDAQTVFNNFMRGLVFQKKQEKRQPSSDD